MSSFALVPVVVSLVLVGVGVLIIGVGVRTTRRSREFKATGVVTRADVTDVRLRRSSRAGHDIDDSGVWVPVVRFALPDGRVVEGETMMGSVPAPARPGQVVEVRYDPDNPTRVNLAHGLVQGGTFGCFFVAMGSAALLLGLAVLGFGLLVASSLSHSQR